MKLLLIMLIYLIAFFSISFEFIKDAHLTLSLKSQKFLFKKKSRFMKVRVVGTIIKAIMELFLPMINSKCYK